MASLIHTWGTQPQERGMGFPCDQIIPCPDDAFYRGVTIQARPRIVFRWLCQMRVAPYSYDWIDNLGRQSPRQLTLGLEELAVGQEVMRDFELVDFAPDQHLTLRIKQGSMAHRFLGDVATSYCVIASEERTSRLLVKIVIRFERGIAGWLTRFVFPWGDLIMMRRQLLNFKKLAEQTTGEL